MPLTDRMWKFGPVLVLAAGGACSGFIAVDHAAGFWDWSFIFVLNALPFVVVALGAAEASLRARRTVIRSPFGLALLIGASLYVAWYPLYRQLAGAPIVGFFYVAIAATAVATIGAMVIIGSAGARRPLDGRCEYCGYLLFGLPTTRCPECGWDSSSNTGAGQ